MCVSRFSHSSDLRVNDNADIEEMFEVTFFFFFSMLHFRLMMRFKTDSSDTD